MNHPLRALFVDCDSYFASVEQHLDVRLRGRPVGVAPVMAESSCCIAASYEAKAFGVKTGTRISDARQLCPGIAIVESKPAEYVRMHHQIVAAVEDCIHVEAVLSIDEMWAWLPFNRREPSFLVNLGQRIKATIARDVSPTIKVSIGVAPNKYLAKLASKMNKPDGFLILECDDLPEALHRLALRDFTGVGKSMEARLHASGIHSARDLCAASKPALHRAWGGILGDRLWHLLRGDELPDLVSSRKSIGHSHVLPPAQRKPDGAWPILCKLLHKATERLRAHGMVAGSMTMHLQFLGGSAWNPEIQFPHSDATLHFMRWLQRLWAERPEPHAPLLQVGVTLLKLLEKANYTPELFQSIVADSLSGQDAKQHRLDETLDQLRTRYGRDVVFFGSVQESRQSAPMRISFTHIPELPLECDSQIQPKPKRLPE
ncbi:MAG: DNA polymerase [Verrucomicrobia bacterium]|nr:MAG: DNA polymerase [Verrucomicrobiota bacterium]